MKRTISFVLVAVLVALGAVAVTAQETIELVFNLTEGELSAEQIAQYEADNPGIKLILIDSSQDTLNARIAAGETPDLIRVQHFSISPLILNGILMDLTDRIAASDVLNADTFLPIGDVFVRDDATYGLVKDWSNDNGLWINLEAFEAAGVEAPEPGTIYTWAEIAELSEQLTVVDGDRVLQIGFGAGGYEPLLRTVLAEFGENLYSEDFSEIIIADNPNAVEFTELFLGIAETGGTWSPIRPWPGGWVGSQFQADQVAIAQVGYWFNEFINATEGDITEHVIFLPAPTFTGESCLPTATNATGLAISASTEHPDEAFAFFEWYIGGQSAIDRSLNGFGLPLSEDMLELLPSDTPFKQNALETALTDIELSGVIPVNPYISAGVVNGAGSG